MIGAFIGGLVIGHVITFISAVFGAAMNERKWKSNAESKK